jgi:hypothetical protein
MRHFTDAKFTQNFSRRTERAEKLGIHRRGEENSIKKRIIETGSENDFLPAQNRVRLQALVNVIKRFSKSHQLRKNSTG